MLRLGNVDADYGVRRVLHQVSLELEAGEMIGVAGPNGAGKSTLVRLLSKVISPTGGEIWLDGVEYRRISRPALARQVAVVPQAPLLPPAFTAMDLVLLGRTPHLGLLARESNRDRRIAQDALEATQALHLAGRRLGELSGGERQRVVIARALAQQPRLLLLDEPTAFLDIGSQLAVLELVRNLNQTQAMTVLAVFHDLSLAAQYCDRMILFGEGRIRAAGSAETVLRPDLLRELYGVEVAILAHPRTGRPLVVPLGAASAESAFEPAGTPRT